MVSSWRADYRQESNQGSRRSSRVLRGLLQRNGQPSCPVNFDFMKEFPDYDVSCGYFDPLQSNSTCFQNLRIPAMGQAWSEYLRICGKFHLKDEATVGACMNNLSTELSIDNKSPSTVIVPTCFPELNYSHYVSNPSNCQGIKTRDEFERLVGPDTISSTLNQTCAGSSLSNYPLCSLCVASIKSTVQTLSSLGPNNSDCLVYKLFYAAGVSNLDGPYSPIMPDII